MNLDGSNGALAFSLPRVELRSSPRGWRGLCFLADGTCREWDCGSVDSLAAAKAQAADQAQRLIGAPRAAGPIESPAAAGADRRDGHILD